MKNEKQVYIMSLEGNEIYNHMVRGKEIDSNYSGMIPYSLELIKLRSEGLVTKTIKTSGKEISDDIINVKFKQKVRSGEQLIQSLSKKVNNIEIKETYKQKLIDFVNVLQSEKHLDEWQELSNDELRQFLYLNGFTITNENGKQTEYVVYKRSSSKSRTGQCLFIKKPLYQNMIDWSRMYLPFEKDSVVDYASLLAYESLVGSSLQSTIEIDPKNILIVDDIDSKFKQVANVVKTGQDGFLDSINEEVEINNSLFDGESLLSSKFFEEGQSMKLLRNHMYKSAAFNTNIQQFLEDKCPDDIQFNEWKIPNMFGEMMLAKDIEYITTPSSLKALKFSNVIGSEKDMWNYWKELVVKEGCIFGVCKHEKKSKRGEDEYGNTIQQTSYQMLNSLLMDKSDMSELTIFEKEYINKLKNDDDFFVQYIIEDANSINSNMMFVDLYKTNNKIVHTKIFRDFRKAEINSYVTHVKRGKLRLKGDYCVMLGNPMEFLYHAIGKWKASSDVALKQNEIYTTLFDFNKEVVGFRNPHTSPSNVLVARNTYNADIENYFNLSDNIVCVNAVDFALQDILSGCDYDSDTLVLFDNKLLLELGKKCFGKYPVCINKVESQKKQYKLNDLDMCVIDNQLSTSQKNIGRVVNLGQQCMSTYWDLLAGGKTESELKSLMKKVDVMTVLSTICIDLAKKFYDIDIEKEIRNVDKTPELTKLKPLFWKYISESKTIADRVIDYNCPMDYLYNEMTGLDYANHRKNVELTDLLVKHNIKNGNRKQEDKILTYVEEMCTKINSINASSNGNSDDEVEERNNRIDDVIKYFNFHVQKLTVKPDTMYAILIHMIKNKSKTVTKLMNILYTTQTEVFLKAFKQK
jgi:hypothetical protein